MASTAEISSMIPSGIFIRYKFANRQYYRSVDKNKDGKYYFIEWKNLDYKSSGWFIYDSDAEDGYGEKNLYFYAKTEEKALPCPSKVQNWTPTVYFKQRIKKVFGFSSLW